MAQGYPFSTRGERIAWLLKHQKLWQGCPAELTDQETRNQAAQIEKNLCSKMKAAKLLSPHTYWPDCHIFQLIQEARRIRRVRKAGHSEDSK